ncbi:MAG TPA: tyrosine--tRNA ligase [Chloroflexia bacterium]|nr:tyrosine--tRNA ligase [Chloroflexia bacterium]
MRFSIAPQIFELFPDYCVGGVIATGIHNQVADDVHNRIHHELQEATTQLRRRFATGESTPGGANPITAYSTIAAWREAFKKVGIKPGEYQSSVEALARRALRPDYVIPSINPAVDISNSVSLRYMVPLGGHDIDALVGDMQVRLAHEGDFFSPIEDTDAQVESVPPGEPVYADDAEVRTRRWVWRQGRKARVTEKSHSIFFPIDGWKNLNEQEVREATQTLKTLLTELLGAQCQEFFLDAEHPGVEWHPASEAKSSGPTIITNLKRERDQIDDLLTRGVAGIVTREELEAKLRSGRQLRVKLGIDPTGPLIHIGRSVALQKLRDFQRLGHKIIMLFGTFTGTIGDASDKQSTRPMLSPEVVEQNVQTYKDQVSLILDASEVEWRYNTEWFANMPFRRGIELMTHFTVSQMIERENFALRLQAGKAVSLQEIIYPILQGYDSVELRSDVEIGGTDQLFNMMAGRELQRIFGQPEQSVLMNKMINAPDGHKMSTSLGNGVYITEDPKNQYAKMLRTVDEQIIEYFEALTRIPLSDIEEMQAAMTRGENPVHFKKKLAWTLVNMYHGQEAADLAAEAFEREIVQKQAPEDMPVYNPPQGVTEMDVRDLLVETKLAASKKEAGRIVEQGGLSVDGEKVTDPRAKINLRDGMVLKRGNRHYAKIKI